MPPGRTRAQIEAAHLSAVGRVHGQADLGAGAVEGEGDEHG